MKKYFKKKLISITTTTGTREVEAYVFGKYAVHKSLNKNNLDWTVTQVASGSSVYLYDYLEEAKDLAIHLNESNLVESQEVIDFIVKNGFDKFHLLGEYMKNQHVVDSYVCEIEAKSLHFIVGQNSLTAWYYNLKGIKTTACVGTFETRKIATTWLKYYSVTARELLVSWVNLGMPAGLIKGDVA